MRGTRRNLEMRLDRFCVTLAFTLLLSNIPCASAQSQKNSSPQAAEKSFDPHDLSGVWMQDHPRLITVDARYWVYKFTLEEPPMSEWAENQFKTSNTSFGPHPYPLPQTNDPT